MIFDGFMEAFGAAKLLRVAVHRACIRVAFFLSGLPEFGSSENGVNGPFGEEHITNDHFCFVGVC